MTDLDIHNVLVIACIGIAATAVMTLALYAARWTKVVDADIIAAIGSVFTRHRDQYRKVGWSVHIAAGILFAFLYVAAWNAIDIKQPFTLAVLGSAIGALHGLLVSYFAAIFLAEHHRLRRMRGSTGFGIAVTQWGAHVVYGFTLGLAAAVYLWLRAR